MRSRGLLMLFVAALAGLAAVFMAARWMQNQGGERGRIAVANADIELGGRISAEMVRMADWPQGSVPAGAFEDSRQLEGRVLLVSMQRGEPLTEARLAPIGTKGGLSAVVPQGKRAMTVRVNDVVGVAGFALPGTYVDVMVNTQDEAGGRNDRDHSISKIVLERILVLAVAQEADRDATKPKVVNAVTLEVTPGEAELLDLARSVGTLSLVLRNQTDPKEAGAGNGATKAEMLGLLRAPPPAASAPAPAPVRRPAAPRPAPPAAMAVAPSSCVELIRGMHKVTECF
ncbi:Flp pilus assembly protein CpaB [Roseateles sp. DAIF2]|uniref:Flp pilus assembly protein CpaB n=1 Tax=Roseateles sp. DAIF2 TaxID=2714952 RepID=UPI0018A2F714|nr:Flp pilus assembly protein CpaB [Roseateles sp. DAIF2]QPF73558.1 Flp pilus assembly protein CpaB [Roseateles sp. DAIF2]